MGDQVFSSKMACADCGVSYPEISRIMKIPVNTIKSHIFRAKALIRRRLGQEVREHAGLVFRYHTNRHFYQFALSGGNRAVLRLRQGFGFGRLFRRFRRCEQRCDGRDACRRGVAQRR